MLETIKACKYPARTVSLRETLTDTLREPCSNYYGHQVATRKTGTWLLRSQI